MKKVSFLIFLIAATGFSQSYPPDAGIAGSTAIYKDSPLYVAWATGITVERGLLKKSDPAFMINGNNKASSGIPENALGYPDGPTVSLGDGGSAILTFDHPIIEGNGFDFAVFENGGPSYLELAVVEVSSDGTNFFRFPCHSQTQTATQIGSFGTPQATYLNNIAGKYAGNYGTPFDLSEIPDNLLLDKNNITHVKVIDVVGSIDPDYATLDSFGNPINDSFPTPFTSCGFDLQAVGVINQAVLSIGDFSGKIPNLYPNPTQDKFYITTQEEKQITIYDISGRVVIDRNFKSDEPVNVTTLNQGIYMVKITISGQNKSSVQRLIIK